MMHRFVSRFLIAGLGFALASQFSLAQADDWEVVKQVPQGQTVKIALASGESIRGTFQSAGDDDITLDHGRTIPKQEIRKILLKKPGHRGRHALIGGAVGAGAGLGIGAAADANCSKGSVLCTGNAGKAIATPLFAALGLAIGAVLPAGGWQTIYKSK